MECLTVISRVISHRKLATNAIIMRIMVEEAKTL
jgi:hypothetical protein